MGNLRKHTDKELWDTLLNVRMRHESNKAGLMEMLANLVVGQLAIIGILNRQRKKENESRLAVQGRYGIPKVTITINDRHHEPQRLAGF